MSASLSRPDFLPPVRLPRVYSLMDIVQLIFNIAIIGGMFYLTLVAGLYVWQRKIIFITGTERPDVVIAGVPDAEIVSVPTADGLRLNAWYAASASADRPVALFLHGNAGHIGHRADRMRRFQAAGWGVLLLDYRGYGGNPGSPTEDGLARDAQAALALLRDRGIAADRLVIWGESLGAAVAIRLATEAPAAALILEAPFTSMVDMARMRYKVVPVGALLKDRFESINRIGALTLPLLIMHGARDTLVPSSMGERLYHAATAPDRQFWHIEDAGHNDLAEHGAVDAGIAFVDQRLADRVATR